MKRVAIILLITLFTAFGCTKLPASQETGVTPGEYKSSKIKSLSELEIENEELKNQLEKTTTELQDLKDDYLSIAKNNDLIMGKLNEAESTLKQIEAEGSELPKFSLEKNDKNNIINYIKERKSTLSKNFKDVRVIPLNNNDDVILFYTVGYGENYNQIFIWEVGKNEPIVVDDAYFGKDGNWKWLLQDKYILIDSGKNPEIEKKILDISEKKIVSTFEINYDNVYLLPGTSNIIIQKAKADSSAPTYEIFDFITGEEKKLNFEFQDRNLKFSVDSINNTINFTGTYVDVDDITYSIKVVMGIDKLMEKYSIKTLEELEEKDNPAINEEEQDLNEEGNI